MEMIAMPHGIAYQNGSPDAGLQDFHNKVIYKIHYILDALVYLMSSNDDSVETRIKMSPYGQHFVKVCYHGSKATAVFNISVKETGIPVAKKHLYI